MKLTLSVSYKVQSKRIVTLTSEPLALKDVKSLLPELKKQKSIIRIDMEDEFGSLWSEKELNKYLERLNEEPHEVTLYFDGGYDKNHKIAGLGTVIYFIQNNKRYRKRVNRQLDLIQNNNEAEFAALYFAIQQLEIIGVHQQSIQIQGDSMQVIHQMNDEWPVTNDAFHYWIDKIEHLLKKLGIRATYELLPRNNNKQADKLATQALAGEEIDAIYEIENE